MSPAGCGRTAGTDEAGRGPLCGPVVAASVVLTEEQAEELLSKYLEQDVSALYVGGTVSAVTDAIVQRLVELHAASEGAPPRDFAWLSLGSQGLERAAGHGHKSDEHDERQHGQRENRAAEQIRLIGEQRGE